MIQMNDSIHKLRKRMHLSQDYVAKYLGVSKSAYAKMESENRKIHSEEIAKLCVLFGIPADRFFEPINSDDAEILNMIRFKEQIIERRNKK